MDNKNRADTQCQPYFLYYLISLNLCQCLTDIIEDILHIFNTYRESDKVWGDAGFTQLLIAELAMGVAIPSVFSASMR